jgi:hypothetical protein
MACRTDRSESAEDVANAEGWAEVFKGVLYLVRRVTTLWSGIADICVADRSLA